MKQDVADITLRLFKMVPPHTSLKVTLSWAENIAAANGYCAADAVSPPAILDCCGSAETSK